MNNKQIKAVHERLISTMESKIQEDKEKEIKQIQKKVQTKLDKIYKINQEKSKLKKEVMEQIKDTIATVYFALNESEPINLTAGYKYKHPEEKKLKKDIDNFIFELTIDDTNALEKIENFTKNLMK